MKKHLVAAIAAASLSTLLAAPAGAAVPRRPPTVTEPCDTGAKSASLWWDAKHLAAKNRCARWLIIDLEYETPDRGSENITVSVAPGAHFNVRLAKLDPVPESGIRGVRFSDGAECGAVFARNSKGKPAYPCG